MTTELATVTTAAKLFLTHGPASYMAIELIYPINISSEVYESSDTLSLPGPSLSFRVRLLEVFKYKRCCAVSWDQPFKKVHPPARTESCPLQTSFQLFQRQKPSSFVSVSPLKELIWSVCFHAQNAFGLTTPTICSLVTAALPPYWDLPLLLSQWQLLCGEKSQPPWEGLPGKHRSAR